MITLRKRFSFQAPKYLDVSNFSLVPSTQLFVQTHHALKFYYMFRLFSLHQLLTQFAFVFSSSAVLS
jgi:hypothetical protein